VDRASRALVGCVSMRSLRHDGRGDAATPYGDMRGRPGLRASRLVASSSQVDRGSQPVARRVANYWCAADHRTSAAFAADVEPPAEWSCRVCSGPSGLERGTAPKATRPRFFPRTPYEFLMMRRTAEDGERILTDALAAMREGCYPRPDPPPTSSLTNKGAGT
jgi:hypothetical protein